MDDKVCKSCGKSLVLPCDPQQRTDTVRMNGHYLCDGKSLCIECYNGSNVDEEEDEAQPSSPPIDT